MKLPKDVYTPDVIAASDCMIGNVTESPTTFIFYVWSMYNLTLECFIYFFSGKIGYGTASEALAYKVPFIFIRRDYFNEEPFVRNMLEV